MTINLLSTKAFFAAREFMEANARPLELARLRFHFDDTPATSVLAELAKYQNKDGGFGNALEPDLRTEDSSALCASIALQILRSTQPTANSTMAFSAINYLVRTFDPQQSHWRIIPPAAELSPHAPWWKQAGRMNSFNHFSLNPTAEILGYLYDYRSIVDKEMLLRLFDPVLSHLSQVEEVEMHELLCCLRLLRTRSLPAKIHDFIMTKVKQFITDTLACEPEQWQGYTLRPLQVIDSPRSPLMAGFEYAVSLNLDYEIDSQNSDGSWTPPWSWGNEYPNEWKIARNEWSGIITLEKLLTLKRFGRIEEPAANEPTVINGR